MHGESRVTVNGKEYTLFVGMSVLARLQKEFGQDVLERLDPPSGASDNWVPDLNIVVSLFSYALERHHSGQFDEWLVDDLVAQNPTALASLIGETFPDQEGAGDGGDTPKKRAKAA